MNLLRPNNDNRVSGIEMDSYQFYSHGSHRAMYKRQRQFSSQSLLALALLPSPGLSSPFLALGLQGFSCFVFSLLKFSASPSHGTLWAGLHGDWRCQTSYVQALVRFLSPLLWASASVTDSLLPVLLLTEVFCQGVCKQAKCVYNGRY